MEIGNLWIDMSLVILAMVTIWLGVSSISGRLFLQKKFWSHVTRVLFRAAIIILVWQGLVYKAVLIEPAYLPIYNSIALIGTLGCLVFIRDSVLDDEAKGVIQKETE